MLPVGEIIQTIIVYTKEVLFIRQERGMNRGREREETKKRKMNGWKDRRKERS